MKKIILCLLLLNSLLAVGCGSNNGKLEPNNPVTLTMWHVYGSQTKSPLNDMIAKFNAGVGRERGVLIKVISVSNSAAIDKVLMASAAAEPGSVPLPDLFTAYPRIMNKLDNNLLLPWENYLSQEDLAVYREDFLKEGYYNQHLYMLPIAKSTELLFVNQTFMERFLAAYNISPQQLTDYDTLFALCPQYYAWSGGRQMFQINDFYHYFLTGMASLGDSFIKDGKPDLTGENFWRIYKPLAQAAIAGGLCVEKGYASDRWKTGEVICNVGSTAGILYLRDYVTYPDNSQEQIATTFLPTPRFKEGSDKHILLQRGTGLFAVRSKQERKNQAAAVFAKWIAQKDNNLEFVTLAGYLPVNKAAMQQLMREPGLVSNKKYRQLYTVLQQVESGGAYLPLPLYANAAATQAKLESSMKQILANAHQRYTHGLSNGAASQPLLERLTRESLGQLQEAMN